MEPSSMHSSAAKLAIIEAEHVHTYPIKTVFLVQNGFSRVSRDGNHYNRLFLGQPAAPPVLKT